MASTLGTRSPHLSRAQALLSAKGRRSQKCFLLEGSTLLAEAQSSGIEIHAIFTTDAAYAATPSISRLEAAGTRAWIVTPRSLERLSDLETPSGIVAVASQRFHSVREILERPGPVVALAGVSDPGNAGTILRSAEAFGAAGVFFSKGGVEPFHPKVVRAAMGALFRIPIALAAAEDLQGVPKARPIVGLKQGAGTRIWGLSGSPVIVVGQERRGLAEWETICADFCSIPMQAGESLNAAVSASIALYETAKNRTQ